MGRWTVQDHSVASIARVHITDLLCMTRPRGTGAWPVFRASFVRVFTVVIARRSRAPGNWLCEWEACSGLGPATTWAARSWPAPWRLEQFECRAAAREHRRTAHHSRAKSPAALAGSTYNRTDDAAANGSRPGVHGAFTLVNTLLWRGPRATTCFISLTLPDGSDRTHASNRATELPAISRPARRPVDVHVKSPSRACSATRARRTC